MTSIPVVKYAVGADQPNPHDKTSALKCFRLFRRGLELQTDYLGSQLLPGGAGSRHCTARHLVAWSVIYSTLYAFLPLVAPLCIALLVGRDRCSEVIAHAGFMTVRKGRQSHGVPSGYAARRW